MRYLNANHGAGGQMKVFDEYPGSKSGSGVYQQIINLMPPHKVYIEPFLGSGAILLKKKPAEAQIGLDLAPAVIARWSRMKRRLMAIPNLSVLQGDALAYLSSDAAILASEDTLVYCDPPYLMETRSSQRKLYTFEYGEIEQHARLLTILKELQCLVMISGYWSDLYESELRTWRPVHYVSMTRSGRPATEYIWCNFQEPDVLHDYQYVGGDYRERERIKRKKQRWVTRL
jgi:site-specific DNA-adenine methylase